MPYVKNGNISIYYEMQGNGPPLVMHHGFARSLEDWKNYGYVERLKNEYTLIIIDARGHGKSDKPHRPEAYTMDERAGDVTSVLDTLQIEKTNFFGYSYGGRVAYELGKCLPERIVSLIIGSCGAGTLSSKYINRNIKQLQDNSEDIPPTSPAKSTTLPDQRLNDINALVAILKQPWIDLQKDLSEMKMPVLLFGGETDYALPGMLEAVKLLPNVTFMSLPGLNHIDVIRQSDLIIPLVKNFLSQFNSSNTYRE
jgi:pimeloyl-ACP methyl ester carboxylesterase